MPYVIRKVYRKNCFKVMNKKTKKIYSKCATKENVKKQVRLLNAIKNNPTFRKNFNKITFIPFPTSIA